MKHRLLKRKIKITHNNFIIKLSISNQQTIIQNLKQKNLNYVSFRFVNFNVSARFNDTQWIRYNDHKNACVVFFDFLHLRNQHQWKWIYYIQRYESNDMKKKIEKYRFNKFATRSNQFVFFVFVVVNASIFCQSIFLFDSLQSIRTRRLIKTRKIQIRKIWNNIRSRNRYRFVVSIFVFVFVLFWNIDRFIILICKYFRDQNFQQDFHFRRIYLFFFFSHIFCFRIYFFTFIAFVLKFSTSIMFKRIFESQSMNFFAMSIDRKNEYSFRNEIWKRRKNNVTSMFEISIEILFYQRKFIWKLARFEIWRSQFIFDIRFSVHICFLNQIFSLCYLLSSRHAFYIECIDDNALKTKNITSNHEKNYLM